ncbi:MAG: THUMP domain-containing protein [Promethearchaeota archaeon]
MSSFNIVLTTNKEKFAETEIWFLLMMLGDETSLIIQSPVDGVLLIDTKLDAFDVIHKIRRFMHRDPEIAQYIMKLIPIEKNVETDLENIKIALDHLMEMKKKVVSEGTFAVQIRKRSTDLTATDIIDVVTNGIKNSVDLKNPDWIIRIEIMGNITGISILQGKEKGDILSTTIERRIISSAR